MSIKYGPPEALTPQELEERGAHLYLLGIMGEIRIKGIKREIPEIDTLEPELKKALNFAHERGYRTDQIEQLGRVVFYFSRSSRDENNQISQKVLAERLEAAIIVLDEVDGKELFKRKWKNEPVKQASKGMEMDTIKHQQSEEKIGLLKRFRNWFFKEGE